MDVNEPGQVLQVTSKLFYCSVCIIVYGLSLMNASVLFLQEHNAATICDESSDESCVACDSNLKSSDEEDNMSTEIHIAFEGDGDSFCVQ